MTQTSSSLSGAEISDIVEIQKVKARYCLGVDLLPTDAVAGEKELHDIFAEDVMADYGSGPLEGRRAVLDFLVPALSATRTWLWHAIHTPLIDLDGDTARGRWTIVAMMREREDGPTGTVVGRYDDAFRRDEKGWKIAAVRWFEGAKM